MTRERQQSPIGRALSAAALQSVIPNLRPTALGLDLFPSKSSWTEGSHSESSSDSSDNTRTATYLDDDDNKFTEKPRSRDRTLNASALSPARQTLLSRPSNSNIGNKSRYNGNRSESDAIDRQRGHRRQQVDSHSGAQSHGLARESDDNHSMEAVRNDHNHRRYQRLLAVEAEPSSSQEMDSEDEIPTRPPLNPTGQTRAPRSVRKSTSQPAMDRPHIKAVPPSITSSSRITLAEPSSRSRSKASVSTILDSTRDFAPHRSSQSIYSTNERPSHTSSSRSFRTSAASIRSSSTAKVSQKVPQRATVRNSRGEIEWKDAPPMPSPGMIHQMRNMSLEPPERQYSNSRPRGQDMYALRASSRSPGYVSSDQDYHSPSPASPNKIPFKSLGAASKGPYVERPRLQRRQSSDSSGGYHTADDDDIEAREWERLRARQMELDRFDVYQQQKQREEDSRIARRLAERERVKAELRERERIASERRKAERNAMRLARQEAERQEAVRLEQQRVEDEARRAKAKEEARQRKMQAKKEAAERKAREEQEAKERQIREKKEAEEREIREKKEAEERQVREAEEAKRKAEEEALRKENERLEAIEAERLAKEAAVQAAKDAILEKVRQLAEAKQQVMEEDRLARRAGRRDEKRAQRALSSVLPDGIAQDKEDDYCSDETDSEPIADTDWTDCVTRKTSAGSKEAGSATTESTSNPEANSSTDASSDMPVTPADDRPFHLAPPQTAGILEEVTSDNGGEGSKMQSLMSGESTPTGQPARLATKQPDRFRRAVQNGPRRNFGTLTVPTATREITDQSTAALDEALVQPRGPHREGGITYGRGWCAHGLADPSLVVDRRRYVRVANTTTASKQAELNSAITESEQSIDTQPEGSYEETVYGELGELIWTATTPDVIVRLVSHLDYADIKALRQTSRSIHFALGELGGREIVLARFLGPIGYQLWKPTKMSMDADAPVVEKDPMPLTFSDCEDFLLSFELMQEYRLVGAEFARAAHKMDPRYPRLARATTRAYNRVLTRLRMQPNFRIPAVPAVRQESLPLSPLLQQAPTLPFEERSTNRTSSPGVMEELVSTNPIKSPWKPGRAGFFRAWVPSTEIGGWLSDVELARCERELFIAGVWSHLRKGDVVWDCAIGEERNDGKYIFDGRYLRDLSFMFDRVGHLPSWLNAFAFVPSYYHNIIQSGDSSQPVVYLDVLPWRDQIVSTMRLVQDQVETLSPQGVRYRVSKWLYRAVINVTAEQVTPAEGSDLTDRGWHGRIVLETEGTAEHAKELISRCAGPSEGKRTKARLLACVMDSSAISSGIPKAPAPVKDSNGIQIDTTSPWAIVRARSRPGLIWIRPLDMRDRVVF